VSDISVISGLIIWILFTGNLIRLSGAYVPLPKKYISNCKKNTQNFAYTSPSSMYVCKVFAETRYFLVLSM
jgi:hypothetical protein